MEFKLKDVSLIIEANIPDLQVSIGKRRSASRMAYGNRSSFKSMGLSSSFMLKMGDIQSKKLS